MTDKTPEQQEIESLRAHNAELLADLKKARTATKDAQAQAEALTGERDSALEAARKITLDDPVQRMAERVALDADLFQMMFARHYQFTQGDDGPEIRNLEGEPVTLKDKAGKERHAAFTENDIKALCDLTPAKESFDRIVIATHATGGGALGSRATAPAAPHKASEPRKAPSAQFGIR